KARVADQRMLDERGGGRVVGEPLWPVAQLQIDLLGRRDAGADLHRSPAREARLAGGDAGLEAQRRVRVQLAAQITRAGHAAIDLVRPAERRDAVDRPRAATRAGAERRGREVIV